MAGSGCGWGFDATTIPGSAFGGRPLVYGEGCEASRQKPQAVCLYLTMGSSIHDHKRHAAEDENLGVFHKQLQRLAGLNDGGPDSCPPRAANLWMAPHAMPGP